METIRIEDENCNIILYLENKILQGYQFNKDNTIEIVNESVMDYFKFLVSSQNYTELADEEEYKVILDNETGLKHYFKNSIEDYTMFFKKNGEYDVCFKGTGGFIKEKISKRFKISRIKELFVICTLSSLLGISISHLTVTPTNIQKLYEILDIEDISINDIENKIGASSLTEEEKKFIYNEDFLLDILPLKNESNYLKYICNKSFNNLNIKSYGPEDDKYEGTLGYYNYNDLGTIHLRDYEELTYAQKDTYSHEFIHMCQVCQSSGYNLIREACAEIISEEYYNSPANSYSRQVKLVKKMMEIIGSEPIWIYNFTGDFSSIEERVKPYLEEEEYEEFIKDLTFETDGKGANTNKIKFASLDKLLNKLYYNIYNIDISEDKIINMIDDDDDTLVRYYFNPRLINQENSYYLDYSSMERMDVSIDEAYSLGLVTCYAETITEVDYNDVLGLREKYNSVNAYIDCKYDWSTIENYHCQGIDGKEYISGKINGVWYENVDIDELAQKGILDVKYFLVERRKLTYNEYINHEYDEDTQISKSVKGNCILFENHVTGSVPLKVNLPTVNERYQLERGKSI